MDGWTELQRLRGAIAVPINNSNSTSNGNSNSRNYIKQQQISVKCEYLKCFLFQLTLNLHQSGRLSTSAKQTPISSRHVIAKLQINVEMIYANKNHKIIDQSIMLRCNQHVFQQ